MLFKHGDLLHVFKTALHCTVDSHWLGAYTIWSLAIAYLTEDSRRDVSVNIQKRVPIHLLSWIIWLGSDLQGSHSVTNCTVERPTYSKCTLQVLKVARLNLVTFTRLIHTWQGYPGYFREPYWKSMGLPENIQGNLTALLIVSHSWM